MASAAQFPELAAVHFPLARGAAGPHRAQRAGEWALPGRLRALSEPGGRGPSLAGASRQGAAIPVAPVLAARAGGALLHSYQLALAALLHLRPAGPVRAQRRGSSLAGARLGRRWRPAAVLVGARSFVLPLARLSSSSHTWVPSSSSVPYALRHAAGVPAAGGGQLRAVRDESGRPGNHRLRLLAPGDAWLSGASDLTLRHVDRPFAVVLPRASAGGQLVMLCADDAAHAMRFDRATTSSRTSISGPQPTTAQSCRSCAARASRNCPSERSAGPMALSITASSTCRRRCARRLRRLHATAGGAGLEQRHAPGRLSVVPAGPAGGTMRLRLLWDLPQERGAYAYAEHNLFVHAVDRQGRVVAQHDWELACSTSIGVWMGYWSPSMRWRCRRTGRPHCAGSTSAPTSALAASRSPGGTPPAARWALRSRSAPSRWRLRRPLRPPPWRPTTASAPGCNWPVTTWRPPP